MMPCVADASADAHLCSVFSCDATKAVPDKNFTIANFKPFDKTEYDACRLPLSNGNSDAEFTNAVSHTAASAINTNVHTASDNARERDPVTHDSQPSSDYNVPDVAQSGYVLPKLVERVLEKTDDISFCNIDPKQM